MINMTLNKRELGILVAKEIKERKFKKIQDKVEGSEKVYCLVTINYHTFVVETLTYEMNVVSKIRDIVTGRTLYTNKMKEENLLEKVELNTVIDEYGYAYQC